jgi:hypothetical protein
MIASNSISISLFDLSIALGFIGFALMFYTLSINKKAIGKLTGVGFLLFSQLFIYIFISIFSGIDDINSKRKKVREVLARSDVKVIFNGKLLDTVKTKEVVTALMTIDNINAHHSHPLHVKPIQLISLKDTLNLEIGQDSDDSTEYWIFSGKNETNEIGRIRTFLEFKNGL